MIKPMALSEIISFWEGQPHIAVIRVDAWRSMKLVSLYIERTTGSVTTAVYCGEDLLSLILFKPDELTPSERREVAVGLISEEAITQSEVAGILGVTQPTISSYMKAWRANKERYLNWSEIILAQFKKKTAHLKG